MIMILNFLIQYFFSIDISTWYHIEYSGAYSYALPLVTVTKCYMPELGMIYGVPPIIHENESVGKYCFNTLMLTASKYNPTVFMKYFKEKHSWEDVQKKIQLEHCKQYVSKVL